MKWILFTLYIIAVALSFKISDIKYRSLNFHTRDYALYLQFASKLFDPESSKQFSLNSDGNNCFFFYGTEGANHFHQSLHFEPIKYLYPILYSFTGSPKILFLFTSLVFFLPILYVALTAETYTKEQIAVLIPVIVLYEIYPAALLTPGYDLRPYIFLSPIFFLSVLSIASSRSLLEELIWFNALFLVREEALILGFALIAYVFARTQEQSMRRKTRIIFVLFFSMWVLFTGGYFFWTQYPTDLFQIIATLIRPIVHITGIKQGVFILLGILIGVVGFLGWRQLGDRLVQQRVLQTLAYSIVFLPLGYALIAYELPGVLLQLPGGFPEALTLPRYHLYLVALLGLILVSLPYLKNNIYNKILVSSLLSICLFLIGLNIFSQEGLFKIVAKYQERTQPASDVFALRFATDRLQSKILVDYSTHQAFHDYEHVYVYNRLPWYMTPGNDRYYPANEALVQALVDNTIEYVVISRNKLGIVKELISESELPNKILFENDEFVAIQILRE